MLPDNTRSHISYSFSDTDLPRIFINNRLLNINQAKTGRSGDMGLSVKSINHKGIMRISAQSGNPAMVNIQRSLFPSVDKPMALEKFVLTNTSDKPLTVEPLLREVTTDTACSKGAPHTIIMRSLNNGSKVLQPGRSTTFAVGFMTTDQPQLPVKINVDAEEKARQDRVAGRPYARVMPTRWLTDTAFKDKTNDTSYFKSFQSVG